MVPDQPLHDLMQMQGRLVLVTGGAGHVGVTAATTYAELGASVVLADRDEEGLRVRADELAHATGQAPEYVVCDLEDEASWRSTLGPAVEGHGRLDVLVHSAAFVGTSDLTGWAVPFEAQTLDTWRRAVEVNLTAPFGLTQLLAPFLRAGSHGGAVVNVSSIYGRVGPDLRLYDDLDLGNPAAYAASKGGLDQLTRWLATVLAPDIRVNSIAPGGILRSQPEPFVSRYVARTPLGRMATTADLKGAFAYLGSDLSAYVTGQTLVVDGGFTTW